MVPNNANTANHPKSTRKLRSSTELWQDDLNNIPLRKAPGTTSYSFTTYSKVQNELRVASANKSRWEQRTSSVDDAVGEIDPALSNPTNNSQDSKQTDDSGYEKDNEALTQEDSQPDKTPNMPLWGSFSPAHYSSLETATKKRKRGRPKGTSTDQSRRKSARIATSEVPADDDEEENQSAAAECTQSQSTAPHDVPPTSAEAPLPPPPAHMTLPSQSLAVPVAPSTHMPLPSQPFVPAPSRHGYLQTISVQQCPTPHGHQQPLPHLHTWAGYNLNDPRVDHTVQPFATALDAYLAAGTNLALQYRLLLDSGVVPLAVGAQDFYRAHGEAAGMSEAIHSFATKITGRMGPAAYADHARNQYVWNAEQHARHVRPQFYQQQQGTRPGSGQQ